MENTKINTRQLRSVSGAFDSLYSEIALMINLNLNGIINTDTVYTYDESGNVESEVISSDVGEELSRTEFEYDLEGNIRTSTTTTPTEVIMKTYSYNVSGDINGVSVRLNP